MSEVIENEAKLRQVEKNLTEQTQAGQYNQHPIPDIDFSNPITLPAMDTWRASKHIFDEASVYAIRSALAAGRPLLVRGDPGTGKSQLARAAAVALNRKFLSHVVTSHTEIQDLWYRFDAVSRLADAQIMGMLQQAKHDAAPENESEQTCTEILNPQKYLSPGIFWWAFDPVSAAKRYQQCQHNVYHPDKDTTPEKTAQWQQGVVLLIDEIDKADSDLPNSLLETLDNGQFFVPWMTSAIGIQSNAIPPLVIITTNEDRQLPGAFVRRCLVLNLELPEDKDAQRDKLIERAVAHYGQNIIQQSESVLVKIADQLYKDRKKSRSLGVTPPGQAEFLDILQILFRLANSTEQQLELLDKIDRFALKKFPGMN